MYHFYHHSTLHAFYWNMRKFTLFLCTVSQLLLSVSTFFVSHCGKSNHAVRPDAECVYFGCLRPWDKTWDNNNNSVCNTHTQNLKNNYHAWMPYILCVYGPNTVVLGARCPQPSSSRCSLSTSYLGRHPSWCRSDTSQSFTLKPLHFWVQVSLFNLLLEDTPQIHNRTKLWDLKRVYLYAGGTQNGWFCPFPFDVPSFASVPALG